MLEAVEIFTDCGLVILIRKLQPNTRSIGPSWFSDKRWEKRGELKGWR